MVNKTFYKLKKVIKYYQQYTNYPRSKWINPTCPLMHPTLRSRAHNVFWVQLYKKMLTYILNILNSGWMQQARSVCGVHEYHIINWSCIQMVTVWLSNCNSTWNFLVWTVMFMPFPWCRLHTFGHQGGQSATPDGEKFAKNQEKEGKNQENRGKKRGKIGKKMQKSGRFFHFAPPDR